MAAHTTRRPRRRRRRSAGVTTTRGGPLASGKWRPAPSAHMWRRRRSRALPLARLPWLLSHLWLALSLLLLLSHGAGVGASYCDTFNYGDSGSLQWARTMNEVEMEKEFRVLRLRCCARNHDEIAWFRVNPVTKERVRLPSPANSSLTELRDDNRTLETTSLQKRDGGLYMCEARNRRDNSQITRHIRVEVKVEETKENKVLQEKNEIRIQRIDDNIKIECSVIGDSRLFEKLPVVWYKDGGSKPKHFPHYSADEEMLPNVKVIPINSLSSTSSLQNVSDVMGQTIIIDPIQPENFGKYVCYQGNDTIIRTVTLVEGGYRKVLSVSVWCLVALLVSLVVLVPFAWLWRIELRLFWKDRFGTLEENDDKEYDVFVSYDAADAPFVLRILVPVLEDHFRYRCFAWERDSIAGDWIPETLVQSVRESRRFLMVLSPALLENRWCTFAMHVALKAVLQLRLHIICVKLQDVDWSQVDVADRSANETIRQVLHVVRTVEWEPSKAESMSLRNQQLIREKSILGIHKIIKRRNEMPEDIIRAPGRSRFWRKLRLYLPPRRTLPLLSKPPASPTSTKSLLSLPQGPDYC